MTAPSGIGTVRALVCEDEPLARRAIREYLRDVEWVEIVGEARDGGEAIRLIQKLEPELVFMDVRMPGLSGLDVLDTVTHRAAVVFTTAYDEYAVSAFELGAVDYLVKPFGKQRLLETLARVRVRLLGEGVSGDHTAPTERAPGRYARRVFARHRGGIVPVAVSDIVHVDATSVGVCVSTGARRLEVDGTLAELEGRLDPTDFVRIHRAHIVNLAHVARIRRYDDRRLSVEMSDGTSLVASRRGSTALREVMA